MHGANRPPFTAVARNQQQQIVADRPFGLPADSIEIVLDLPMPTSTNRLYGRRSTYPGGPLKGVHKAPKYVQWMQEADMMVMAAKAYPKRKITGPFQFELLLSTEHCGDGDNRIKAALDWLQSRNIIRNDSDCRRGSWAWVELERAPRGARVILKSLHEAAR